MSNKIIDTINDAAKYKDIQRKVNQAVASIQDKKAHGLWSYCIEDLGFLKYIDEKTYKEEYDQLISELTTWFLFFYSEDPYGKKSFLHSILHSLFELNAPDKDYFAGLMNEIENRFDSAILKYSVVEKNNKYYITAQKRTADIYSSKIKDYFELCNFLKKHEDVFTPLEDLSYRLKALMLNDYEFIKSNNSILQEYPFRKLEKPVDKNNAEEMHHLSVCLTSISSIILIGNDIIYRCYKYSRDYNIAEIEDNKDLSKEINIYNRIVYVLKQCEPIIVLSNGRLRDLVLCDQSWERKIQIIQKEEYINWLMSIIYGFCNPEAFPNADRKQISLVLISNLHRVSYVLARDFFEQYFCEMNELINDENKEALEIAKTIYIQSVANNDTEDKCFTKIKKIIDEKGIVLDDSITKVKLFIWLSKAGKKLINSAEAFYKFASGEMERSADASSISTAFFRIIEIELNNKLIVPMVVNTKDNDLHTMMKDHMKTLSGSDKDSYNKKWWLIIKKLGQMSNDQNITMELGAIRNLLNLLAGEKESRSENDDPVAAVLLTNIEGLLTSKGIQALTNGQMINLISEERVAKYRNPLSHTDIIPFSVAEESRSITINSLYLLMDWIKQ